MESAKSKATNGEMPSLKPPGRGLTGYLARLFHIVHKPAPEGVHTAFIRESFIVEQKGRAFLVLKWALEKDPETKAIEVLGVTENTPEREQTLRRIVRLMTACWRPHARPRHPDELVGLICRIRVEHHRGWTKQTALVPLVMDYGLALRMDANGLDEDDMMP